MLGICSTVMMHMPSIVPYPVLCEARQPPQQKRWLVKGEQGALRQEAYQESNKRGLP